MVTDCVDDTLPEQDGHAEEESGGRCVLDTGLFPRVPNLPTAST